MATASAAGNTITSLDPIPSAVPEATPRQSGRRSPRVASRPASSGTRSRYDAAQTSDLNRKHWAGVDYLSASAANAPDVRMKLRARSRYEIANNGYAKGLVRGRTNDTIGCGPRLQVDLPESYHDADFDRDIPVGTPQADASVLARAVERRWRDWCESVDFTDKLRLAATAEDGDGETFGVMTSNPMLPANGPQLDVRLYEADQISTPGLWLQTPTEVDGIRYDAHGNPVEYHFLTYHPGDNYWGLDPLDYRRVPADRVIHLFERHRPGQLRGIPALTPGLPLYAILRRYTLANLLTAEAQARINAVIEQENALAGCDDGGDEDDADDGAGEQIHFAGTQMLTLSAGQKAHTLQPSAPGPSYREFKSEVLTESARSVGAPRNVAIGSSAEYNYSSGRLDHLPYQQEIRIRRERYERTFVDRVFKAWLAEALLIPGYLPAGLPPVESWEWRWHWDGFPSIDPLKDANAAKVRKEIGLATDAEELAREGKDWREHYHQLAREKQLREQLGIEPMATAPATAAAGVPAKRQPESSDDMDRDEKREEEDAGA
jgi:lambda family phage portal protein